MLMHRAAGVQPQLHDMPAGNTNLVWHGGRLLALMDSAVPFLLNVSAGHVQSMHSYTFDGTLDHEFCAHPKVDPKTGEMISFGCKCALRYPRHPLKDLWLLFHRCIAQDVPCLAECATVVRYIACVCAFDGFLL